MYDLQIFDMSCLVAVYSDSTSTFPTMLMASSVHVRRGAGFTDIRRVEIRIILQLFQKVLLSFCLYFSVLPLFQCFASISVYCCQSCQNEYNNCDG